MAFYFRKFNSSEASEANDLFLFVSHAATILPACGQKCSVKNGLISMKQTVTTTAKYCAPRNMARRNKLLYKVQMQFVVQVVSLRFLKNDPDRNTARQPKKIFSKMHSKAKKLMSEPKFLSKFIAFRPVKGSSKLESHSRSTSR